MAHPPRDTPLADRPADVRTDSTAATVDTPSANAPIVPKKYLWPFILLTTLFALWGLANNMTDVLLATFKRIMSMSDMQTSLIQVAFYGSYFCLALPAAMFIRRFTYKAGVLLGLGLFAAGALLFYPASQTMVYGHFLVALFILAGGLAFLETSANPYAIEMGPEASSTQRLNLAQSFNPIGSITGVVIGREFILSHLDQATEAERAVMGAEALRQVQQAELWAVMGPYVTVACVIVVLWFVIAFTKFPQAAAAGSAFDLPGTLARLFRVRHYTLGVIAQFFYVGAQVGVWSFTIRYVMEELALNEEDASDYLLASIILFSISRFVCTALMKYVAPHRLLWILAAAAAVLCGHSGDADGRLRGGLRPRRHLRLHVADVSDDLRLGRAGPRRRHQDRGLGPGDGDPGGRRDDGSAGAGLGPFRHPRRLPRPACLLPRRHLLWLAWLQS